MPLACRRPGSDAAFRPVAPALGLSGVAAYYGLQNLGLLYTTAGTAALLQAALPVATAALAALVLRERVARRVLAGLALATVGVAVVCRGRAARPGHSVDRRWGRRLRAVHRSPSPAGHRPASDPGVVDDP